MKVRDIMTREVSTCAPDAPASEAARILWEQDCGVVPVVGPDGRVAGIVTDRDICMAAFIRGTALSQFTVREAMSASVACVRPGQDLQAAHDLLREHQVRRLPVLDTEDRVTGILSLNDLARHASTLKGNAASRAERDVAKTLAAISRHRAPATAE